MGLLVIAGAFVLALSLVVSEVRRNLADPRAVAEASQVPGWKPCTYCAQTVTEAWVQSLRAGDAPGPQTG